jgi:hypothetical protein
LSWPTYYSYFVQRKAPEEPLGRRASKVYFFKFFCPEWQAPLQYLGSFRSEDRAPLSDVFREVNARLGTPPDTELLVYMQLQGNSVRQLTTAASTTFDVANVSSGTTLIFAFMTIDLSHVTFEPLPPIVADGEETAAVTATPEKTELPVRHISEYLGSSGQNTLEAYLARRSGQPINVTLFSYQERTHPICILRLFPSTKPADVMAFAKHVSGVEVDPLHDTFLLYKKEWAKDGPSSVPIRTDWFTSAQQMFTAAAGEKLWAYFRVIKGVAPDQFSRSILVSVELKDVDGQVKTTDMAMPTAFFYSEVKRRLVEIDFIQEDGPPVFGTTSDGWNVSVLTDSSRMTTGQTIRMQIIPEGLRQLTGDEKLLPITITYLDTADYLRTSGWPSFVRITRDQILADLKQDIGARLEIPDDKVQKAKFFTGGRSVYFSPQSAMKDDAVLWDVPEPSPVLVLVDTKRKGKRAREEELKIDN